MLLISWWWWLDDHTREDDQDYDGYRVSDWCQMDPIPGVQWQLDNVLLWLGTLWDWTQHHSVVYISTVHSTSVHTVYVIVQQHSSQFLLILISGTSQNQLKLYVLKNYWVRFRFVLSTLFLDFLLLILLVNLY